MADAGKILIVPKGNYSSNVSYEVLDLVKHNEVLWLAKKDVTGVEPSDASEEYWFKIIDESQFALQTSVDNIQTTRRATLSTAGWYRVAEFNSSGGSAENFDISIRTGFNSSYPEYARLRARNVHTSHTIQCLDRVNVSGTPLFTKARIAYDSSKVYFEVYYSANSANPVRVDISNGLSPWADGGWKAIEPTLTSETASGVTVTTTYDIPKNATPVIVNGDRIFSNNGTKVMGIHNTNSAYTLFTFYGQDAELGSLGFDGANNPMYRGADGKTGSLLHTGNKPIGTYTGNGSDTARYVTTNGIGESIKIVSNNWTAFLSQGTGFAVKTDGTVIGLTGAHAWFNEVGTFQITTSHEALNASGVEYTYHVL